MSLLNVMTSNNPKMDCNTLYLNYGHNVTFNFANFSVLLFSPCICNCVAGFISSHMEAFKLQMVVQAPMSATASSNYYLGPWMRDPQYEGRENMFPQKFRDDAPDQVKRSCGMRTVPLSFDNIILLNERGE